MSKDPMRVAVDSVMRIFSEEYGSKFTLSEERPRVWLQLLRGFAPDTVLAAAYHIVSLPREWPPEIGVLRQECIRLNNGMTSRMSPYEAWEHVQNKIKDKEFVLTEFEKKAVNRIGTIWNLRNSENPGIDRANFIRAFNEIVDEWETEQLTSPHIKRFIDSKATKLPPKEDVKRIEATQDNRSAGISQADISKLVNGIFDS